MSNLRIIKTGNFMIASTKPLPYSDKPYLVQKSESIIDSIVDDKYMTVASKHTDKVNITQIAGKAKNLTKAPYIDKQDGKEYIGAFSKNLNFDPNVLKSMPKGYYGLSIEMDYVADASKVKNGILSVPITDAALGVVALVQTPRHGTKDIDLSNTSVQSMYDSSDFADGECLLIATEDTVYLQDSEQCTTLLDKNTGVQYEEKGSNTGGFNLKEMTEKIVASIKDMLPVSANQDIKNGDTPVDKRELVALIDSTLKDCIENRIGEIARKVFEENSSMRDSILDSLKEDNKNADVAVQLERLKESVTKSKQENEKLVAELDNKEKIIQTMTSTLTGTPSVAEPKEPVTVTVKDSDLEFSFLKDLNKI